MLSFSDFQQLDLRVAKIISAEKVEGSEKLVKLEVDLGDPSANSGLGRKQIIAGIGKNYEPESLLGQQIIVVANLEPKIMTIRSDSGQVVLESQGMLLAANSESGPILLIPDRDTESGSKVR